MNSDPKKKVCCRILMFLASPSKGLGGSDVTYAKDLLSKQKQYDDTVIYVDGGLQYQPEMKSYWKSVWNEAAVPQKCYWIGDGDSVAASAAHLHQIHLNPQKDLSDFAAALETLVCPDVSAQSFEIYVVGGLGGRKDHEWANLCEAHNFVMRLMTNFGCEVKIFFDRDVLVLSGKVSFFSANPWSVFSSFPEAKVEIKDAKYEGQLSLKGPSHGLSNHCLAEKNATVVSKMTPLMLFFN